MNTIVATFPKSNRKKKVENVKIDIPEYTNT
jgi:hypothetical protein